ncbi:MAG: FCD domain-containing protein [Thermoleophilia bacterium]|nr:FCD domain-containing protein [Thermoleophilia bacterium]
MMTRLAELDRFEVESERSYLDAVWVYKLTCYESAERPRLLETVSLLVRRLARYNALALGDKHRLEESLVFQRRFGQACERRDGSAAELVIREAMDWSSTYLTEKVAASWLSRGVGA